MQTLKNADIREAARNASVRIWEIARALGLSDNTFTRRLRDELPAAEKAKIFEIIHRLAKEGGAE